MNEGTLNFHGSSDLSYALLVVEDGDVDIQGGSYNVYLPGNTTIEQGDSLVLIEVGEGHTLSVSENTAGNIQIGSTVFVSYDDLSEIEEELRSASPRTRRSTGKSRSPRKARRRRRAPGPIPSPAPGPAPEPAPSPAAGPIPGLAPSQAPSQAPGPAAARAARPWWSKT